jgi:hypothetical protein
MRRIIKSYVAFGAVSYFSTLSHKRHDFPKKTEHELCVLISQKFLIKIIQRDIIKNLHMYILKVPVIIVRLQLNWNFPDIFSRNTQIPNFMGIRPVGAELFHADGQTNGQTDRHDVANSRLSQFCARA